MSDLQQTGIQKTHAAIERGKQKGIALVSHCIVGYPRPDMNLEVINALIGAGAELMEIQFPFSDPLADGPVVALANQQSVDRGTSIDDCFALASQATAAHPEVAFIAMTYLNIVYRRGIEKFVADLAVANVAAVIIPDLPPEQSAAFRAACDEHGIATVFLVTPLTTDARLAEIAKMTTGFIYCVGRPGVTGKATNFDAEMLAFISKVKAVASVPVGVGFGIRSAQDVAAITGTSDMAIVGTAVIQRIDSDGVAATAEFVGALRAQ